MRPVRASNDTDLSSNTSGSVLSGSIFILRLRDQSFLELVRGLPAQLSSIFSYISRAYFRRLPRPPRAGALRRTQPEHAAPLPQRSAQLGRLGPGAADGRRRRSGRRPRSPISSCASCATGCGPARRIHVEVSTTGSRAGRRRSCASPPTWPCVRSPPTQACAAPRPPAPAGRT